RLRDLRRRLALLHLPSEHVAHLAQREEVCEQQRQEAVLVHLAELVAAQVSDLFLVDHAEAAVDEWLVEALRLDSNFAVHQQVGLHQVLDERVGAKSRGLKLLAEFQDRLGRGARLCAVEQQLALVEVADRARRRVEAQRKLVRVGPQAGEQEGIATQIGRDIDVRIERAAILIEEDVHALVEAHQGNRHRRPTNREDDRVMTLDQSELVDGQGNGVRAPHLGHARDATNLHLAVLVEVDRLNAVIEKRHSFVRSGTRHLKVFSWGPGLAAARLPHPPTGYGSEGLYWPRARK